MSLKQLAAPATTVPPGKSAALEPGDILLQDAAADYQACQLPTHEQYTWDQVDDQAGLSSYLILLACRKHISNVAHSSTFPALHLTDHMAQQVQGEPTMWHNPSTSHGCRRLIVMLITARA